MVWGYIKEISRIWSSWIFAISGILGIYTQITNQTFLFYPWVYWIVAGACFTVANILLFRQQEKRLRDYEAQEPNLVFTACDWQITNRDIRMVFSLYDESPIDGLENNGMPMSSYFVANVEIENYGKEPGVFEWELSTAEFGNIFKLDSEETKGTFGKFSGEVGGRDRYSGKWELRLQHCVSNIKDFAEILKIPQDYKVVINYWTKKIGGKSEIKSVVMSGDLSIYANEVADKWERRGFRAFAQIARNK